MAHTLAAHLTTTRAGTGGPPDDEEEKRARIVEEIAGWTLTVLFAMLAVRLGLFA